MRRTAGSHYGLDEVPRGRNPTNHTRRTGILTVCAEDGSVVTATLRNGSIVGARHQDLDVDPVEAIREALRFDMGRFSFRQVKVELASGPPRSIGSTLLEASSRNDEAARTG